MSIQRFLFGVSEKEKEKVTKINVELGDPMAKINGKNRKGNTALHIAVKKDNLEMVESLAADSNVDINSKDNFGNTALHLACQKKDGTALLYVNALVTNRTDINAQNSLGETPLHCAVQEGNSEVVQFLLQKKAKTNLATLIFHKNSRLDPGLSLPIHYAFYGDKLSSAIIEALLDNGLNLYTENATGLMPFQLALQHRDINSLSKIVMDKLIKRLFNYELTPSGKTYLHLIAENSQLNRQTFSEVISYLNLTNIINIKDKYNKTAFFSAIQNNNDEKALILFHKGADPNIGNDKTYPLHIAIQNNMKIAHTIINNDFDLTSLDNNGWSPLVWAAEKGDEKVIDALNQHKVDFKGPQGKLAVKRALLHQNKDVLKKLIQYGANPDVHIEILNHNNTKLSFSSCSFSSYDNSVTKPRFLKNGDTPLHFAVKTGDMELAKICLEKEPSMVNSKNADDKTPCHVAIKVLSPEMAHLLQTNGAKIESYQTNDKDNNCIESLMMQGARRAFVSSENVKAFFKDKEYCLTGPQIIAREKILEKYQKQANLDHVTLFYHRMTVSDKESDHNIENRFQFSNKK